MIFEAKEAVEVIEASDVIMSVEVIEAPEVFKTTLVLEINKLMAITERYTTLLSEKYLILFRTQIHQIFLVFP